MSPISFAPSRLIHDTRFVQYSGRTSTESTARGSGLSALIKSCPVNASRFAKLHLWIRGSGGRHRRQRRDGPQKRPGGWRERRH